jgi:hypothetical protein
MALRIISFFCGALFGGGSAVFTFYLQHSDIWWSIVGLAALVMGVLAFVFGRLFWEHAGDLWPW